MNFLIKHKEIIKNFKWRAVQILFKQGTLFLIFIFCLKFLKETEFGLLSFLLSISFFLTLITDFGVSTTVSKLIVEAKGERKTEEAIIFNSILVILLVLLVLTPFFLFFEKFFLQDKYSGYLIFLFLITFFSSLSSIYDGVFRGQEKFRTAALITIAIMFINIPISFYLISVYSITGALLSQVLFNLLLAAFYFLFFGKIRNKKISKEVIKNVLSYSALIGIGTLGFYSFAKIDIIIMGFFGYFNEIAAYEVINRFLLIFIFPFAIFSQVYAPNFTKKILDKRYEEIYLTIKKMSFVFLIIAILIALGLYFILPLLVSIISPVYLTESFYKIFPICLLIFVIDVTSDRGIAIPLGYAKYMAIFYPIIGIINISLAFLFNFFWGYIGIIFATLFSMLLMTILLRIKVLLVLKNLFAMTSQKNL